MISVDEKNKGSNFKSLADLLGTKLNSTSQNQHFNIFYIPMLILCRTALDLNIHAVTLKLPAVSSLINSYANK